MSRTAEFLILLLFATCLAAETNFGPVSLGRELPQNLPECKPADQRPCQHSLDEIWNVPYQGARMHVTSSGGCQSAMSANCPVAHVKVFIPEQQCNSYLTALQRKFGVPRITIRTMQDASGARWTNSVYEWERDNGDAVVYSIHQQNTGGCELDAATATFQAESEHRASQDDLKVGSTKDVIGGIVYYAYLVCILMWPVAAVVGGLLVWRRVRILYRRCVMTNKRS
ncbi:MAG TPA: hypothetical protein VFJ47_16055 [Terriglobales bacterium]|nr:hypothetical protein [Terriglobales bacterium]